MELYRDIGDPGAVACVNTAQCLQPGPDGHVPGGQCVAGRCQPAINQGTSHFSPEIVDRPKSDGVPAGPYWVHVFSQQQQETAYDLTVTVTPNEACQRDWRERDLQNGNDARGNATFLGGGDRRLCDAWVCQNGDSPPDEDWHAIDVAPGEDKTVQIGFQTFVDGRLLLETQSPDPMNPELVLRERSAAQQVNGQCINLHGGELMNRVVIRVRSEGTFIEDGEPEDHGRVDYHLNVVRTDLSANPNGECARLIGAGGDIDWNSVELP
jgi:hypothetical protein